MIDKISETPKTNINTEKWVGRLIELSNDILVSYENHLLDTTDSSWELAFVMKLLHEHIELYPDTSKFTVTPPK